MKLIQILAIILLLSFFSIHSQSYSDFESLMIESEKNPNITKLAKQKAKEHNLPLIIYFPNEATMYPIAVKNDKIIYAVIPDPKHPYKGGYLSSFSDIKKSFNLNEAQLTFSTGQNHLNNIKPTKQLMNSDSLFLICESSNDRVMAFDVYSGDLVDADFIPSSTMLTTPIKALSSSRGTILISDQVKDLVQEFDTSGAFIGSFAPAGGVNPAILDNIRGITYHPNGNLLVSVASGSNADAIAEFDTAGNYLGNFVTPNTAIMDGPWDILFRTSDVLVGASSSDAIHRYDHSGNYLSDFATSIAWPHQMIELKNGDIALAQFSLPNTGIQIYPPTGGTYTQLLTGVTGNRGLAELGNGNFLTTNGGGVYEVDRTTGNLVRTIITGPGNILSSRYISLYIVETNEAVFNVAPTFMDFGTVYEDSSKTDSVLVKNQGNVELEISSIISDNPDFVVIPDSANLSPGDSLYFNITFTAGQDSGHQTGSIVFSHNASTSPDTLPVSAYVVKLAAAFHLSSTSLDFGFVYEDSSQTESVIVRNDGNADLVIPSIISTNPNFVVFPDSAIIIPGDSLYFDVTFTAGQDSGYQSGSIIFSHNASTSPDSVSVSAYVITSLEKIETNIPNHFELKQNYPNPFNPITTIKFSIPKSEFVTLKIYNTLGQEVASLVSDKLNAGSYKYTWDAGSLASGVYVYKIQAGTYLENRKLIYMK